MKKDKVDIVLINPGDRKQVYQDLGKDLAAIEPPFWIAVIESVKKECIVQKRHR